MHRPISSRSILSAVRTNLLNLAAVTMLMTGFGCATSPLANQRVDTYTPQVQSGDRMPWKAGAHAAGSSTDDSGAAPVDASAADGSLTEGNDNAAVPVNSSPTGQEIRTLRRADHLLISMRGIPRPEEVADVVDRDGNITLPLVGAMRVEGMTTSDAESAIEQAYIDGGYYNKIDVILVAQEDSFYVRGEVVRPGKYSLTGDTTLLMAITAAGGYTPWANPRKIRVLRGNEVISLNGTRIEQRQDEDCFIEPNDIIVVERKIFL